MYGLAPMALAHVAKQESIGATRQASLAFMESFVPVIWGARTASRGRQSGNIGLVSFHH
jgi:hypothetical protein